jgi:hypothetical protein
MAVKTPLDVGIVARVAAGIRYAFTGAKPNEWFSPLTPITPVVPEEQRPSVEGRQLDYPVGYNTRITPRQGEPVAFPQMRALADGYDLLRLVIETRKDQIAKMQWTIKPTDPEKQPDNRCQEIQDFFRFPDKENSWDDWLRMMLEEMLVTDATSIYVRPTLGGKPYSFEIIDGATVSRKLDALGRTPQPPEVAFQQVLHGVPAVDYTAEELIYAPRNKRAHRVYGYSPVEQIIMTVNIALRRQIHQLQYYTEGSAPDLIFSVPAEWNPDQTRKFKQWWDEQLVGNTGARRGSMFVPDGVHSVNTKEAALKDEYDEWLARVVCYAFSISPTAFVKQNNRATAENASEQALSEGLAPIMQWVKGVVDRLIMQHFGVSDLEFDWVSEEAIDPLIQAQVDQIYVINKVKTPNEIREQLGLEALTPEERESAFPTPVAPEPEPMSTNNNQQDDKESTPAEKMEIHNHINVEAPQIGLPNIHVDAPNITFPDIKMDAPVVNVTTPDVIVDIGATTIKAEFDMPAPIQANPRAVTKSIIAKRNEDGSLSGEIIETPIGEPEKASRITNTVEFEKEFNPNQPRDAKGRWGGGESDKKKDENPAFVSNNPKDYVDKAVRHEDIAKLPADRQPVLMAMYEKAAENKNQFDAKNEKIASNVNGKAAIVGLKGSERAVEKAFADYKDKLPNGKQDPNGKPDPSQIKDLLRTTIEVNSLKDVAPAVAALRETYGEPSKFNDTLNVDAKSRGGYRDVNMVVNVNGSKAEIQVNVKEMLDAKARYHAQYETMRSLTALVEKENRKMTSEERTIYNRAAHTARVGYNRAWAKVAGLKKFDYFDDDDYNAEWR